MPQPKNDSVVANIGDKSTSYKRNLALKETEKKEQKKLVIV